VQWLQAHREAAGSLETDGALVGEEANDGHRVGDVDHDSLAGLEHSITIVKRSC
jgi:hypothetical protein